MKQRQPLRIVSVIVGAEGAQAQAFSGWRMFLIAHGPIHASYGSPTPPG
jgi:hypothetical protein